MQERAWKAIRIACLMLVLGACGGEKAKAPQPTAQPSGATEPVTAAEPVTEPPAAEPVTAAEPAPEPTAEPTASEPVTTPAPTPDVPAAVDPPPPEAEPEPVPEPEPEPEPEPVVPTPPPTVTEPEPEAPPQVVTPPPAEPDVPVSTPPAPTPSAGVVDPGGVIAVAAPKPGLEPTGTKKCKLCHKLQHASWAETAHAKREPPLGCEGCHGPGSEYEKMSVMKDPEQARIAGLVDPEREFCATCHVSGWSDDMLQRTHAHKP